MGFLDWLKRLLGIGPPKRDISRLAGVPEAQVEAVEEEIDLSGGPLKSGHLRRALRDRRLLPKKRGIARITGLEKRPRYMEAEEAGRLFSGTMRTCDRKIRDLLADEAQLERYGLPAWRDEHELAAALEISIGELRFFSIHREMERAAHYVTFAIPKRGGGRRLIMAPKRRLKEIQRKLHQRLVSRLPVSDHAHGFRCGRSIRSGAAPHLGRRVVLHMDIKDFFPSIHFGRVRGMLVAMGYGYPVATTLAVLMTEAPRQPTDVDGTIYHVPVGSRYCVQGAPTSPGLSNALLQRMDRRLAGAARSVRFAYTRYADDLSFSGDDIEAAHRLQHLASRIIEEEGFAVNREKTRVMRRGSRQTVTGVVVNEQLGLSRKRRRLLRAELHRAGEQVRNGNADAKLLARLRGKLAYVAMLNQKQAATLRRSFL
ncbi:MAG: reverse transcriptase family protein [Acidobacteriota bacterium]